MSSSGGLVRTNEEALLGRARAGDEAAFASLVDRYSGELTLHCYRIVGSVQDAEDLVQEALLAAWRGGSRWSATTKARPIASRVS